MRPIAEIGKQYRRAVIINRDHPCWGYGQGAVARRFGLRRRDFIWVTNHKNWRDKVAGISRNTLVIDPCNLTHEWCEEDGIEFAMGIRAAFDYVVMAPQCEEALARWLSERNPPLYARMVAAGVGVTAEPGARDRTAELQQEQQTLQP